LSAELGRSFYRTKLSGGGSMPRVEGLQVRVVPAPDGDTAELVELTGVLRAELLDLDVDSVDLPGDDAPPGQAKGVATVLGWLTVQLSAAEGLRAVVSAVRGWAARTNRAVEVRVGGDVLKLTGVTAEQQDRIIDGWLARHTSGT
jgi:hypothetical protein